MALHRHRRLLLSLGTALSALAGLVAALVPAVRVPVYVGLGAAFLLCLSAAMTMATLLNRRLPRRLVAAPEPGAFTTPRLGSGVLLGLSAVPGCVLLISAAGFEIAGGGHWQAATAAIVAVLAFCGYALAQSWIVPGVRLTPDGLFADGVAGSTFVPWLAFDRDAPVSAGDTDFQVRLHLARPELVRRTRLSTVSDRITFEGTDPAFLRDVIAHYATDPDARAAIGTPTELARLAALPPTEDRDADERILRPGATWAGVTGYAVTALAGINLPATSGSRWIDALGTVLAALGAFGLANSIRFGAILKQRRSISRTP